MSAVFILRGKFPLVSIWTLSISGARCNGDLELEIPNPSILSIDEEHEAAATVIAARRSARMPNPFVQHFFRRLSIEMRCRRLSEPFSIILSLSPAPQLCCRVVRHFCVAISVFRIVLSDGD